MVKRQLAENLLVGIVCNLLASSGVLENVVGGIQKALSKMAGDLPEQLRAKKGEIAALEKRIFNLVSFIAQGNASPAVATALSESEARLTSLHEEYDLLARSQKSLSTPSAKWVKSRLLKVGELLTRRAGEVSPLLRSLLGSVTLEPTERENGKSYLTAKGEVSFLKAVALLASQDGMGQGFAYIPLVDAMCALENQGHLSDFWCISLYVCPSPAKYLRIRAQVLRLRQKGLTKAAIAQKIGVDRGTVIRALSPHRMS